MVVAVDVGPDVNAVTLTASVPAALYNSKVFVVVFFTVYIVSVETAELST